TERTPISLQARAIRTAISPRFAIRIFRNIFTCSNRRSQKPCVHSVGARHAVPEAASASPKPLTYVPRQLYLGQAPVARQLATSHATVYHGLAFRKSQRRNDGRGRTEPVEKGSCPSGRSARARRHDRRPRHRY